MAGSYRDLLVWKKGMELTRQVYQATRCGKFPREELYGLAGQLRRAAVSVPSNIAEGQARRGTAEFIQFLHVAKGSLAELDTQLQISLELGYLTQTAHTDLAAKVAELQRMVFSLITRLREK